MEREKCKHADDASVLE